MVVMYVPAVITIYYPTWIVYQLLISVIKAYIQMVPLSQAVISLLSVIKHSTYVQNYYHCTPCKGLVAILTSGENQQHTLFIEHLKCIKFGRFWSATARRNPTN